MDVLGLNGKGRLMTSALTLAPTATSLDRNPAAVYLARLAPGSRRTLGQALDVIAKLLAPGTTAAAFPWHELRYQHTAAVRAELADRYAAATANKMLSALRGVLQEAWRLGLMDAETYHRAVDLTPVRGTAAPAGRALDRAELGRLFVALAADPTPAGTRDAAVRAVLAGGGLRRAEVVALDRADYDRATGALVIRDGKGGKARTSYATNGAATALAAWLDVRGDAPGAMFVPINKAGRFTPRRMTDQAIYTMLARRAEAAGLAEFSPHDLRRTWIGDLLTAGVDLATVQHLAGHARPDTTARYDRRGEDTRRAAATLLHVPYVAPPLNSSVNTKR